MHFINLDIIGFLTHPSYDNISACDEQKFVMRFITHLFFAIFIFLPRMFYPVGIIVNLLPGLLVRYHACLMQDSNWNSFNRNLQCFDASDVCLLMKSSELINNDLTEP